MNGRDPTPTETPASAPPVHCHLDGFVLIDEEVHFARHDIFTGLRINEPRRVRRCTNRDHSMIPVLWALDGDRWVLLP